ncbi:TIGR04283 family arsenosugar biosynthesis glycosyltransferase [Loigolactobacillus jiayinensis]|uniref:Glycosyltransferase family 2 protein n=1 Tax=Loigolactobacillus jiayinensis TaxID=2486016 RepID=A0ABW1RF74_9LACO|nr:glycosyltransferase family 2 protein [Loigolactobacillus jiayinensis]
MWLTIIIPTYHDDVKLQYLVTQFAAWPLVGVAVLIVDGQKRQRPEWLPDDYGYLYCSQPNRGRQLRLGASQAQTDKLLFLHSDSFFPQGSPLTYLRQTSVEVGFFTLQFDRTTHFFKRLARQSNWRARTRKLIFGDQAFFVTRSAYERSGGFPDQPLMEDFAFSRRLAHQHYQFHQIPLIIQTSARQYQMAGPYRTLFKMQCIQLLYMMGCPPTWLRRLYYRKEQRS